MRKEKRRRKRRKRRRKTVRKLTLFFFLFLLFFFQIWKEEETKKRIRFSGFYLAAFGLASIYNFFAPKPKRFHNFFFFFFFFFFVFFFKKKLRFLLLHVCPFLCFAPFRSVRLFSPNPRPSVPLSIYLFFFYHFFHFFIYFFGLNFRCSPVPNSGPKQKNPLKTHSYPVKPSKTQ